MKEIIRPSDRRLHRNATQPLYEEEWNDPYKDMVPPDWPKDVSFTFEPASLEEIKRDPSVPRWRIRPLRP